MKNLQNYLTESSTYTKKEIEYILHKMEKWNTFKNWIKIDNSDNEEYIECEMNLCELGIAQIANYLDDFDENDIIDLGDMSDTISNELSEMVYNGEIDDLFPYFDDWESIMVCTNMVWDKISKKLPFPIEY